jgi:serine/threonine protein kinase
MAQALMVLQEHKVFHRDIKPRNIFLCEDGSFKLGWRCFVLSWNVCDFIWQGTTASRASTGLH